jgi:small subunit ribosomal protein S16
MLKIKLARIGKKNQPLYRVTICEAKTNLGGKVIETIGNYNPLDKSKKIEINKSRYDYWIAKGAQPSQTVRNLVNKK